MPDGAARNVPGELTAEVLMLTDLAALTPPLLVAVVILIAAGAFLRHEMRRGKNSAEHGDESDSRPESGRSGDRD